MAIRIGTGSNDTHPTNIEVNEQTSLLHARGDVLQERLENIERDRSSVPAHCSLAVLLLHLGIFLTTDRSRLRALSGLVVLIVVVIVFDAYVVKQCGVEGLSSERLKHLTWALSGAIAISAVDLFMVKHTSKQYL